MQTTQTMYFWKKKKIWTKLTRNRILYLHTTFCVVDSRVSRSALRGSNRDSKIHERMCFGRLLKSYTCTSRKSLFWKNVKKKLGYHLNYKVFDTCKVSEIPQHRERIYIVGFLDKMLCERFHFDFYTCVQNRPLCELLQTNVPEKKNTIIRTSWLCLIRWKKGVKEHISTNTLYQYRRYYVRENKSNCCPTLTANMGSGGHNVPLLRDDHGIRKLTPRECFNLQGFPSDYQLPALSDSALYKLAGNAVSVPVVECIVKQLVGVTKNMSDVDVESDSATVEPSAIQE